MVALRLVGLQAQSERSAVAEKAEPRSVGRARLLMGRTTHRRAAVSGSLPCCRGRGYEGYRPYVHAPGVEIVICTFASSSSSFFRLRHSESKQSSVAPPSSLGRALLSAPPTESRRRQEPSMVRCTCRHARAHSLSLMCSKSRTRALPGSTERRVFVKSHRCTCRNAAQLDVVRVVVRYQGYPCSTESPERRKLQWSLLSIAEA